MQGADPYALCAHLKRFDDRQNVCQYQTMQGIEHLKAEMSGLRNLVFSQSRRDNLDVQALRQLNEVSQHVRDQARNHPGKIPYVSAFLHELFYRCLLVL